MRHPLRSALIALFVLIGVDQVVHYSVLSDGYLSGRRIAPFDPPLFCEAQQQAQDQYLLHANTGRPLEAEFLFDADLGWAPTPGESHGAMHFDWSGSRRGPEELSRPKPPDLARIVTIGCSFTLGDEVADEEAWPHVLDRARPELEVANLAMGAYGLDQALMRLRRDGLKLAPDEIWLGWLPAASLRIVTMYRPAQRHWSTPTLFKPRFQLDEYGGLAERSNPAKSVAQTARLLSRQNEFYEALVHGDLWVGRAERAYRPNGSSLFHRSALGRLFLTAQERGDRDSMEWVLDEESEVHRLIHAIVSATADEARAIDARFRLLILPGRGDLLDRVERGSAYWDPLSQSLSDRGIEVIDLSEALLRAGAQDRGAYWMPGGHYSPAANQLVATELEGYL